MRLKTFFHHSNFPNARVLCLLCSALLAPCSSAWAQQPRKIPRIGYLDGGFASTNAGRIKAFRQGLGELGYVEGKTIIVEYRLTEGKLDRLPHFRTS